MRSFVSFTLFILTAFCVSVYAIGDDDFDRLDGMGASGKTVNVIEWEGNLEIHVYPAGSLAGLSLQIDKKKHGDPVMVIGYRFSNAPRSILVRRAVLGISLKEPFKTYYEHLGDYEKITITNNTLGSNLREFVLDPPQAEKYPEGHPALMPADAKSPEASQAPGKATSSEPASAEPGSPKEFSW